MKQTKPNHEVQQQPVEPGSVVKLTASTTAVKSITNPVKLSLAIFSVLLSFIVISLITLISSHASAVTTTSSANASVNVSSACTMTGGPNSAGNIYTGTITPGTSEEFGTTTLKSVCNDPLGYSVYAIGFSNDKYGNNELISSNGENDIATGTSGTNSWWAMKIGTSGSSYVPIITNDFNNWHTVPDTYTQVAKYTGATDDGTVGSITTADYKVNVSSSQVAGTYTGKVKYTLVHPNTAAAPLTDKQIAVNYHANGDMFADGATTNHVVYKNSCTDIYVGNDYYVSKTPNIESDGVAKTGYDNDRFTQNSPVTFSGADRLKVELDYGIDADNSALFVFEGTYDGEINDDMEVEGGFTAFTGHQNGLEPGTSDILYIDGDTVTFAFLSYGYDIDVEEGGQGLYGYYAKIYPIYNTKHDNAAAVEFCNGIFVDSGAYATTNTGWNGSWYTTIDGKDMNFIDESEVINYINESVDDLSGSTLELYRGLTFGEAYINDGKFAIGDGYILQDMTNTICRVAAIGQTITLLDSRDNEKYLVGKLKDGNCWLLDNLRLDSTNSTILNNLDTANTNADNASLISLKSGNRTAGDQYATAGLSGSNWTSGYSYSVPMANTGAAPERSNQYTKDTVADVTYGEGSGKVGVYYNYCAASAGSHCYGNGTTALRFRTGDAEFDICPAGWRMPTGGNYGEYKTLYDAYHGAYQQEKFMAALSIPLSGYVEAGSRSYDKNSMFWSSTDSGAYEYKYALYIVKYSVRLQYVRPSTNFRQSWGFPVRCILSS